MGVGAFRPKFYANEVIPCSAKMLIALQLDRWKFLDINESL